ncbi:MAG: hypothetical protein IAE91_13335, partial [Ignavibacteriaceae bacterium]|nr:hypothetical protein [Ignavibacteriaceae bacterium]
VGSFVSLSEYSKSSPVYRVYITSQAEKVFAEFNLSWKEPGKGNFVFLYQFTTKLFTPQDFYNTEITRNLGIESEYSDNEIINKNLQRGQATGSYLLKISVKDNLGNIIGEDEKEIVFLNQSQSFSILYPQNNSVIAISDLTISWESVPGVTNYSIDLAQVKQGHRSDIEALNSGEMLLNKYSASNSNSINLNDLLTGRIKEGMKLVVRVAAALPGQSGGEILFAEPVSFLVFSSEDEALKEAIRSLTNSLDAKNVTSTAKDIIISNFAVYELFDETGKPLSKYEAIEIILKLIKSNSSMSGYKDLFNFSFPFISQGN